ncbi:hypothetical protein D623_10022162 [Myotis brandtii]|uniref:Katanin p80 subunit C-terminal domain-containing protein n=1 Tax=Myotis brandtii TaxID=109478 RepID=S7Q969_MYOBR|nr:hypothetical protein D623_10022162 [Myotis brandtii]
MSGLTVGHAVKSPDKLRKVIYHRKKVHYPFPNSCFKKKQSPRSGSCDMVSQDHETMAQVLFSRNLRLNVALTFWKKRSISELVAYLVRIEDLGVVVDCLPVLTNRNIQILKQQLSRLWEQENHLTLVPGYTGNIAKDVDAYLLQLH